jgi:hypothetical protein
MAKKKVKKEEKTLSDVIERIFKTKSVVSIDLDDIGVVIGDRKFSFSGKLKIGPLIIGESQEKEKRKKK